MIFRSFIRKLFEAFSFVQNFYRITKLNFLYPGMDLDYNCIIGKNCEIKCTSGSYLKITNSIIKSGTIIVADHNSEIEIINSFIGYNCVIVSRNKITIKKNCLIAEMVVIRDQNHKFEESNLIISKQGFKVSPITIEDNVWLAAKSTILAGSIIGKNTVVGANAVVRGKLDCNSVYVGVPAKKVKIQS